MSKKRIFFRNIKFFLLIFIIALSFFVFGKAKAGSNDNVSGWAWSENIGWISFNCDNEELPEPRCSVDYGVNVDASTGVFSGYAWSENIGWIDFAPDAPYPDLPNYSACLNFPGSGQTCDGVGDNKISGWAKALNTDSWIKLRDGTYGVERNLSNNEFEGWAWSDTIIGWLSFNCNNEELPEPRCVDSNYKVMINIDIDSTAPEITDFRVDGYTNEQDPVYATSSITITWTASDTGGSGIDHYELWRADDLEGVPIDWSQINSDATSGITDDPEDGGAYWYGLHAVDTAGNCITANIEAPDYGHCGGVSSDSLDERTDRGPIEVEVIRDDTAPSVDAFYITHDVPWVNNSNPYIDIFWEVTDSGGSHLSYVEVWRADDVDGVPGTWSQVGEDYDAPIGVDEWTSSASDSPLEKGILWYGLHAVDIDGNCIDETGAHCGGISSDSLDPRTAVGPIKAQVDTINPTSRIESPTTSSWFVGNVLLDTLDEDGGSGLKPYSCEYKVIAYPYSTSTGYTTLDWTDRDCNEPYLEITVNEEDGLCRYESVDASDDSCRIYVQAYDLAGNKGGSNTGYRIDWTTTTPGKLYITDTEAEQIYPIQINEGAQYTFKSHVTDNIKVSACDLYIGNTLKGSMNVLECSTDCTASRNFTFDDTGTYNNNFVRCDDAAENVTDSESVIIEVIQGSALRIDDITFTTTPPGGGISGIDYCATPTTQSGCNVYFEVDVYNPSGNDLIYDWDFGDGNNSTEESPSHHYTSANNYNVSVDVSDGIEVVQGILNVPVSDPNPDIEGGLSVSLTADPAWGTDSLSGVDLRAIVGGSMFGTINYKFDCANDDSWELEVSNQSISDYIAANLCDYGSLGTYTAKVSVDRGTGSAENTANIDVVASECTPYTQTSCTSPQGCSHTITCQGNSTWPACPIDECTISDVQSCGNGGTQTCISSCVWDICTGEGECSPGPDSPVCPCPIDGCVSQDYYDYPNFGDCTDPYSCSTGFGTGEPCEPTIIVNAPQCNESPICDSLGASPEQGVAPLDVLFTGSAHDNDGTITNYDFIFGDDESGTTIDNTINHIYNNPGLYCAKLRVQDNDGTWTSIPGDCPSVCAKQINISENNPPLADVDCNGSDCGPGSVCNGSWTAYNRNCQFYFLNESTDPNSTNPPDDNNDIIKSTWSIFYQEGVPWQDPYIICADNSETPENEGICDLLLPTLPASQNYYVTLTVEDSVGATDDYSKNFYVRREAAADFQCSLNPEDGWQSCNGFTASEGEVVYFEDISIPSEGSTGISSWSWTFEDGDPVTSNEQNPSANFVNITGSSGIVTIDVTDNIGRTDTEQYQLQITIPLPQWEEVVPF